MLLFRAITNRAVLHLDLWEVQAVKRQHVTTIEMLIKRLGTSLAFCTTFIERIAGDLLCAASCLSLPTKIGYFVPLDGYWPVFTFHDSFPRICSYRWIVNG